MSPANTMELLTKLSEVAKSSKDLTILNSVIQQADTKNEIKILNISKFATEVGCSRAVLNSLLVRAVDADLLYKIDSGHYLLNPFVLMGNGLSSRKKELQVEAQVRWRELTGYLTAKDKEKLAKLSTHLELDDVLTCTDFNLSVANYYDKNGSITDKQKACLL